MKREKRVMLLGMMPGLLKSEVEDVREYIQRKFPEFEVRVLVGMLAAHTFTMEVDDTPEAETRKGAYL